MELNENVKRVIEATSLIGRNSGYIKRALKKEMITAWGKTMMVKVLQAKKDDKNRVIATTRLLHYSNTAGIAAKISKGIFTGDEYKDFCRGVATSALYHDFGQDPFGHDGEAALTYASEEFNGGARLHNIDGAMSIIYRQSDKIKNAINSGKIINEEIKKRENTITESQLIERMERGLEPEIKAKIQKETIKNQDIIDDAINIIAMSAGNHNGERGKADIIPNYNRTFEDFYKTALKTYVDANEDKKMESCNIVDAIVKISDQISSIPYDIIDAKRAGIEDEIFLGWAEPISMILHIPIEEAEEKLKGNNKELKLLVKSLQEKIINSVINSSDKNKIDMDLAQWLYGATDSQGQVITNGLRTFNLGQHIAFTSTAESEIILNNMSADLVDNLSKTILDENERFPRDLNGIFRISKNNPGRKINEKQLINRFNGNDKLKNFYQYIVELTPEEYQENKKIVKSRETEYYREIIINALKKRKNLLEGIEQRSPRKSNAYLVEEYMLSPSYEAMSCKHNTYPDEEIKKMVDRINAYLGTNPVEGKENLSLLVQRHKYQQGIDGEAEKVPTFKQRMTTDKQIAARVAISYLVTLSDLEFINLASELGVLNNSERQIFERPYSEYSAKRLGKNGHKTISAKKAENDYKDGSPILG